MRPGDGNFLDFLRLRCDFEGDGGWGRSPFQISAVIPKIAVNPTVRKMLEVLTPVVTIGEVRTEDDHLVVALRPHVGGVASALSALRRAR